MSIKQFDLNLVDCICGPLKYTPVKFYYNYCFGEVKFYYNLRNPKHGATTRHRLACNKTFISQVLGLYRIANTGTCQRQQVISSISQ